MIDYLAALGRLGLSVFVIGLFQLMAWSSNVLRQNNVVFDLHVRMSVVSIQMLICGLVMLAYHGCIFLYRRAVSFQYRNLENIDHEQGAQTEMYSTYVIEDSPRQSQSSAASTENDTSHRDNVRAENDVPPRSHHTPETMPESFAANSANISAHVTASDNRSINQTLDTESLQNPQAGVFVSNPTCYVMFAHCAGLVLWLTLFYIDFFDQYTTVLFIAGAVISWFSLLIFDGPHDIRNVCFRLSYFCSNCILLSASRVCTSFDIEDLKQKFETDSSFTLLENVLPFCTGAVWVLLFKYKDMPRDLHAALGTSALLCLPALVRVRGSELYARIDELHSNSWAILFVLQPLFKFLCTYVWILTVSTNRLRVVLTGGTLALMPFFLEYCIMDHTTSQVFYTALGVLCFLELLYIVIGPQKTES